MFRAFPCFLGSVLLFLFCLELAAAADEDYYKILGVSRDASEQDIKKRFRHLSRTEHPDKKPGDKKAAERFKLISTAYEVLSDKTQRQIYDQSGVEGLRQFAQNGGQNPHNPFGAFWPFGGQQQQGAQKQPDTVLDFMVTLEDLYSGRSLRVEHTKQVLCTKCRGSGAKNQDDVKTCPHCNGQGVRVQIQRMGPMQFQTQVPCDQCGGRGKTVTSTCPKCHGDKVHSGSERMYIIVEKGMPDRHEIRVENGGDQGPDVIPGDLVFRLNTQSHPRFTRVNSKDLAIDFVITLKEALVGFSKTLQHLDGHDVVIARDEVTPFNFVMRIPNEGMPVHNFPSDFGTLIVTFKVQFPATLTSAQKEAFKKLL